MDSAVNTSFKMAHEKINSILTPKGLFRNMIVAMSQFPRNHRRPVMPGTRFKKSSSGRHKLPYDFKDATPCRIARGMASRAPMYAPCYQPS